MNIFENLENLNVSEECFNDIMGIVEAKLADRMNVKQLQNVTNNAIPQREKVYSENKKKYGEGDMRTMNSKLRLNYAKNLSKGLDSDVKYAPKSSVNQAKKNAKEYAFGSYDPGVHATASVGNGLKSNYATDYYKEEAIRSKAEWKERRRKREREMDRKYLKKISPRKGL